ncbi:MAG TPA: helix-turn-helix transcriptional regulator [Nitriliruptorales bacterium]|nr:helix-turn-helix transcriptional regulator [Nitriliruptorales bacterium]
MIERDHDRSGGVAEAARVGAAARLSDLGDYIREQRSRAQYSLRHLARLAGVSNPYLSQIERGLRKPSAEILQAIAKALQISSETLYVKAGILEERTDVPDLEVAILRDEDLNERQRAALIEIYRSFRHENESEAVGQATPSAGADPTDGSTGHPPAAHPLEQGAVAASE